MIHHGRVLGLPLVDYTATQAEIEALSAEAGMTAFATDTELWGYCDGAAWVWAHTRYTDAKAEAVADTQIATHAADADAHHAAVTLDVNASGAAVLRDAGTPFTAGRVLFATDGDKVEDDDGLVYDSVNKRVRVGGALDPPAGLYVVGGSGASIGLQMQNSEANNTAKYARIKVGHYVNNEEPVTLFSHGSLAAQNQLAIGGSVATENALTRILVFLGGSTTTLSGTDILRIENTGSLLIGTTTDGMTAGGSLAIAQDLAHRGSCVGFYNTTPITKPTITGSRGGNAALASLLTALASLGLLTNSSTA